MAVEGEEVVAAGPAVPREVRKKQIEEELEADPKERERRQRREEKRKDNEARTQRNREYFGERFQRPLSELTEDEALELIDGYKTAGNVYFKEGNFAWARANYGDAAMFLERGLHKPQELSDSMPMMGGGGGAEDVTGRFAGPLRQLHGNQALCCIKAGKPGLALKHVERGLAVGGASPPPPLEWAKLLYREAQAHSALEDYASARESLRKAAEKDPKSRDIRSALATATAALKVQREAELERSKAAFAGKLSKEGKEAVQLFEPEPEKPKEPEPEPEPVPPIHRRIYNAAANLLTEKDMEKRFWERVKIWFRNLWGAILLALINYFNPNSGMSSLGQSLHRAKQYNHFLEAEIQRRAEEELKKHDSDDEDYYNWLEGKEPDIDAT